MLRIAQEALTFDDVLLVPGYSDVVATEVGLSRKEVKQFSMVRLSDGKPLKHTGSISCADCHERYEERGYISRESEDAMQEFLSELTKETPASEKDEPISRPGP